MYTRAFWDEIYRRHFRDAPWMSNSCVIGHIRNIEKFLSDYKGSSFLEEGIREKKLLDYGCGNGKLAYHFYSSRGLHVDLADISDELIKKLNKKYGKFDIGIYDVETPAELQKLGKSYDIIIATSLFHHIVPMLWTQFLTEFASILQPSGLLIISGWDETDEVIAADNNTARFTGGRTWPLNPLIENIQQLDVFETIVNRVEDLPVSAFPRPRKIRYYMLKKI